MMFVDCPAYLDHEGAVRCGLPAEVTCRFTMRSTDGPLESATIRCPAGHWFNGPIESLTLEGGGVRAGDVEGENVPEHVVEHRGAGSLGQLNNGVPRSP
jgi:hypothetical protein